MRNQRMLDIGHAIAAAAETRKPGGSFIDLATDAEQRLKNAGYAIVRKDELQRSNMQEVVSRLSGAGP